MRTEYKRVGGREISGLAERDISGRAGTKAMLMDMVRDENCEYKRDVGGRTRGQGKGGEKGGKKGVGDDSWNEVWNVNRDALKMVRRILCMVPVQRFEHRLFIKIRLWV